MGEILLNKDKLKLLLETKKNVIGNRNENIISDLFAGVTFTIPNIFAEYPEFNFCGFEVNGYRCKSILLIIGIIFVIRGICMLVRDFSKGYTNKDLYKDIENLNEITHQFSIVAIKDTFNEHANRFLLHYEPDWDCDLFFSFKTKENAEQNEDNIKNNLSSMLDVDKDKITITYKTQAIQRKYSERDKIVKVYDHTYYLAEIKKFKKNEKTDEFEYDGIKYKWLSIADMLKIPRIKEVNQDVVDMVKNYM